MSQAEALTDAGFTTRLERFIAGVNQICAEANLHSPRVIKLRSGRGKCLALDVIEYAHDDPNMEGEGRPSSVFCFIAAQDNYTKALGHVKKGDVLKSASYKVPAKHARGNIYDDHGGLRGASGEHPIRWTGPEYLR
jgi:hypothetical protein